MRVRLDARERVTAEAARPSRLHGHGHGHDQHSLPLSLQHFPLLLLQNLLFTKIVE